MVKIRIIELKTADCIVLAIACEENRLSNGTRLSRTFRIQLVLFVKQMMKLSFGLWGLSSK